MLAVYNEEKTPLQPRTCDRPLAPCRRLLGPASRVERIPLSRHRTSLAGDPWTSPSVGILADRPQLYGADRIRRPRLALHSTPAALWQGRPRLIHRACLQL